MLNRDERTFDDIVLSTIKNVKGANIGISNTSDGSVIRLLIDIMSDEVSNLIDYSNSIYDSLNIDTMEGSELDRIGACVGVSRLGAKKGVGVVKFSTGDSPASSAITIPQGYSVYAGGDGDGLEFKTLSSATIASGSYNVSVDVECQVAQKINLGVGAINTLGTSLVGVNSVKNEYVVSSGRDIEDDDSYRIRIKDGRLETCGSAPNIKMACENIVGVESADVYDGATAGDFSVKIRSHLTSTSSMMSEVTSLINTIKPVGCNPTVALSTYTNIAYAILIKDINNNTIMTTSDQDALIKDFFMLETENIATSIYNTHKMQKYIQSLVGDNCAIAITATIGTTPYSNGFFPKPDGVAYKVSTITINNTVV